MIKIAQGVAHKIPKDMKEVILSSEKLGEIWNGLTPLARNEWICWVMSVKKPETRIKHLKRMEEDLRKGKRRPCCWGGCPHRS